MCNLKMSGKNSSQIKKMKQGMSYTVKEKIIIMNVFKYFHQEYPNLRITEIVRRTAHATGCSEKSVFQFRKEETSGFKEPSKTKIRKNLNINSRDIKYDNEIREIIRTTIYDLRNKNVVPSLNTVLKHLRTKNEIPKFSLMTLRRLLFDMGFYYQKTGSKCILVENFDKKLDNNHLHGDETEQKNFKNPINENNVLQENQILKNNSKQLQLENMPIQVSYHEIQSFHSTPSHSWWIPTPSHHYGCIPPPNHYECVPSTNFGLQK